MNQQKQSRYFIIAIFIFMNSQFTDESVFSITKLLYNQFMEEEKEKKLDEDNLDQFKKQYIKPLYPHKSIRQNNGDVRIQKYECSEFCCDLSPGRFCCCRTTQPDKVYEDFGLGICIYSKFMKHITCFLFIMSILALVPILLYYMVGIYNQYNIADSYNNVLFSGSIGIVSSSYLQCQYRLIQNNGAAFILNCPVGQVHLVGLTFTNQSKIGIQNCRQEQENFQLSDYVPSNYVETSSCSTTSDSCVVQVSLTSLTHSSDPTYSYTSVSYSYQCRNSVYPLGQVSLSDEIVLYIIVATDLVILFSFLAFLISEHFSQKAEIDNFKKKKLALDDFSVRVNGFRQNQLLEELDYFIKYYHHDKKDDPKKKDDQYVNVDEDLYSSIVQIKITETEEYSKSIEKRRQKYNQLFNIIDNCFFEESIDPRKYTDHEDFIKKCYGSNQSEEYMNYKRSLETAIKDFVASKNVKYYDEESQNKKTSVILVFSNPRTKRKLFKSANKKCFRNQIKVYNNTYYLEEPPVADMIIWENQFKFTCCRVILAWVITIIFCFCSYLLVGLAQYKKTELASNNQFNQDCDILFSNTDFTVYDDARVNEKAYHHCFCYEQLFTYGFQLDANCYTWFSDYALYLAIPILISVGIVIYNLVISKLFKLLTKFEAHDDITAELFSYTIKRTFVLILNMGLILILVNLNYHGSWNNQSFQFLFEGTYSDITSDWYYNIGVIITFTLCFNIFLPILQILVASAFKCFRKLWDTRCWTQKTSAKTKKQFIDKYSGDVFPIQERYADLLSTLTITITFSAVLPMLYIIAFLSIGFMLLSDKVLMFKIFQKPLNYTSKLHDNVFKAIFFLILVHCVISPLLLSAPGLMLAGGILSIDGLLIDSGNQRLNNIIQSGYLVPYVVLFILFVVWIFLYITIIQLCSFCFEKCTKNIKIFHRNKLNSNFLATLNSLQLNRLKYSTEKQIAMIQALSRTQPQKGRIELTEDSLMESTRRLYLSQQIEERTKKNIEKISAIPSKARLQSLDNVSLIGKAGYDDSFNDQVLYRDKKIKLLDEHLKKLSKQTGQNRQGPKQRQYPSQTTNQFEKITIEMVGDDV